MTKVYDVAVIGAGPGGYVSAIRAAQNGLDTVCVDAFTSPQGRPALGGTCLNVGCIPSKSLLQSSELFSQIRRDAAAHGITLRSPLIDAVQMIKRKDDIVARLTQGIALLFQKNGVASVAGRAELLDESDGAWRIKVTQGDGEQTLRARHAIVAAGSRPRPLPGVEVDNLRILDSQGALALTAVPKRLGVIGAGVIGLELGSVWSRLGAEVTLLEMADAFLPALDARLAKDAQKKLSAEGLDMRFGARIVDVVARKNDVRIVYRQGDEQHELTVDKLIVAVGREPALDGLGVEDLGLKRTRAAGWRWTNCAAPACRGCGPSATRCAVRCWRTRRWPKGLWSPTKSSASRRNP